MHPRSSFHISRPGRDRPAGFTIIELLIVIAILLLLTTFTILSVDFAFESERVRSGARQVQSALEGARDRAIKSRQPRGIRFLLDDDPDNGRVVSSMVYVGAAEPWTRGQITLLRRDLNFDGVVDAGADSDKVWMIRGEGTSWNMLKRRGFLGINEDRNGNGVLDPTEDLNGNGGLDVETPRIKIPGDRNGTWYHVNTALLGVVPGVPDLLLLTRPYRDPGTTPPSEVVAFEGTGINTYILELPPRVLADAEPIILPQGVVIDLDASLVPSSWRPTSGGYTRRYSNRMDLMFTPRGTVLGDAAGAGLLHFYITRREDVTTATTLANRPAVNRGSRPRVPADGLFAAINSANWTGSEAPKIGDRSLVSVFSATGKVASHPLDVTDLFNNSTGAAGADGYVDDPFLFAERGEVSSK